MNLRVIFTGVFGCLICVTATGQIPVLKHADVVFMNPASPQVYQAYDATVLAWGGKPNKQSLEQARGVKYFGSVGMVTEFSSYYERFPETYEQGLCRDLKNQPFKVPWLTDLQHKGIPYWWCCTRQPLFRQYISERVADTVKAGADGVHIDDHLGSAGPLWMGGCFCERCVDEFHAFLKRLPPARLSACGIQEPGTFNFRDEVVRWLAEKPDRKFNEHPLWPEWRVYQLRGAADFMRDLRGLAARTAGHPVPLSANACLLWGPHLNDYQSLDFFSAEIEHHAPEKRLSDSPLLAYRLADEVGRPLAATASGGDWAFIKEHNLPGLVQSWIALSYAAGNFLMAPNRQWCYTPEKGTHWYEGPQEKFAPLYQFVRQNAMLFDGYTNHADLAVAFSQRAFDRDSAKLLKVCAQLSAANLSYRILLGGDEVVDHPLSAHEVRESSHLLIIDSQEFLPADRELLASVDKRKLLNGIEQALTNLAPVVSLETTAKVRALPRVKRGSAVIHIVNWDYDPNLDSVRPVKMLKLKFDLARLGVPSAKSARAFRPQHEPEEIPLEKGSVILPNLGLWSVLQLNSK